MTPSLVTTGVDIIGIHMVDKWLSLGYRVFVVDDLSGVVIENVDSMMKVYVGNIVDAEILSVLFDEHKEQRR